MSPTSFVALTVLVVLTFRSAPSAVVMKVRAIFCSVGSLLNAPAIAMSSVNRYQSRHSDASCGFFDVDSATPIS